MIDHPFDDEELLTIFEFARIAMADGEIFDAVAEQMDISDDEMLRLAVRLDDFMSEHGMGPIDPYEG